MTPELDHVFVFVDRADAEAGGAAFEALRRSGLEPSYRRRHHGQGTANVCWCFDDAYLELLYVVDRDELASPAVARNGFAARSTGEAGALPFGIAVRGDLPGERWPYRIDAFPPGLSIPVAVESDDLRLPFLFGSPGTAPPVEWRDGRAGERQTAAGLDRLRIERLVLSPEAPPSPLLDRLVAVGVIGAVARCTDGPRLDLRLGPRLRLSLPAFATAVVD